MALHAAPLLFDFEIEASQNLTFIPLGVRYNLDCCGMRISLTDWQRLPHEQRLCLARLPLVQQAAGYAPGAFDAVLTELVRTHLHSEPERFIPDANPPWLDATAVPAQVVQQCALAGIGPFDQAAWAGLTLLQRYALLKLSRKPARNHDFPHAAAEFGLIQPAGK